MLLGSKNPKVGRPAEERGARIETILRLATGVVLVGRPAEERGARIETYSEVGVDVG